MINTACVYTAVPTQEPESAMTHAALWLIEQHPCYLSGAETVFEVS